MSQGVIPLSAGGGGAAVRGKINDALQRLQTKGSGTSRPSDIAIGEDWIETDNPGAGTWSWWLYDGTSDILLGTIDSTTHKFTPASATFDSLLGSTKGMLAKRGASAWAGLAVGSAYDMLQVNAAGDDLEYVRQGWRRLAADAVPASAASVDFTSIPSTVKSLMFLFNLRPATDAVALRLRFSASGSFDTGANYDYADVYGYPGGNGVSSATGGTSIAVASNIKNASGGAGGLRGTVIIPDVQVGEYTRALIDSTYDSSSGNNNFRFAGAGVRRVAGPIDGVRFDFNSGNIASGRITALALYA